MIIILYLHNIMIKDHWLLRSDSDPRRLLHRMYIGTTPRLQYIIHAPRVCAVTLKPAMKCLCVCVWSRLLYMPFRHNNYAVGHFVWRIPRPRCTIQRGGYYFITIITPYGTWVQQQSVSLRGEAWCRVYNDIIYYYIITDVRNNVHYTRVYITINSV